MCRSSRITYNCGHVVRIPDLCQAAQWQRPVYACSGWDDPLRELPGTLNKDCPRCERRGGLPQRYAPTPTAAHTRVHEYGSGYGYEESESRGARGDPDPSSHEVRRRVSEWANQVPPGAPPTSHASIARELYRPHEHDRVRTIPSSRRHSSAGVESHESRHHRRQRDIYDLRRPDTGHVSRTEFESDQSTRYIRASDDDRRSSQTTRRPHERPFSTSADDNSAYHRYDDSVVEVTETHLTGDGTEITRATTYRIEQHSAHPENISFADSQSKRTGEGYRGATRRGRGIYGGSGGMAYLRGPQPPQPPRRFW